MVHGIPRVQRKRKSGMYGIIQSRENETVNGMCNIFSFVNHYIENSAIYEQRQF